MLLQELVNNVAILKKLIFQQPQQQLKPQHCSTSSIQLEHQLFKMKRERERERERGTIVLSICLQVIYLNIFSSLDQREKKLTKTSPVACVKSKLRQITRPGIPICQKLADSEIVRL